MKNYFKNLLCCSCLASVAVASTQQGHDRLGDNCSTPGSADVLPDIDVGQGANIPYYVHNPRGAAKLLSKIGISQAAVELAMSSWWDDFLLVVRNCGLIDTSDTNYGLKTSLLADTLLGFPAGGGDVTLSRLGGLLQQVSSAGCSTGTCHGGHSYYDIFCRAPAIRGSCDKLMAKFLAGLTNLISAKTAITELTSDDLPKIFSTYCQYIESLQNNVPLPDLSKIYRDISTAISWGVPLAIVQGVALHEVLTLLTREQDLVNYMDAVTEARNRHPDLFNPPFQDFVAKSKRAGSFLPTFNEGMEIFPTHLPNFIRHNSKSADCCENVLRILMSLLVLQKDSTGTYSLNMSKLNNMPLLVQNYFEKFANNPLALLTDGSYQNHKDWLHVLYSLINSDCKNIIMVREDQKLHYKSELDTGLINIFKLMKYLLEGKNFEFPPTQPTTGNSGQLPISAQQLAKEFYDVFKDNGLGLPVKVYIAYQAPTTIVPECKTYKVHEDYFGDFEFGPYVLAYLPGSAATKVVASSIARRFKYVATNAGAPTVPEGLKYVAPEVSGSEGQSLVDVFVAASQGLIESLFGSSKVPDEYIYDSMLALLSSSRSVFELKLLECKNEVVKAMRPLLANNTYAPRFCGSLARVIYALFPDPKARDDAMRLLEGQPSQSQKDGAEENQKTSVTESKENKLTRQIKEYFNQKDLPIKNKYKTPGTRATFSITPINLTYPPTPMTLTQVQSTPTDGKTGTDDKVDDDVA